MKKRGVGKIKRQFEPGQTTMTSQSATCVLVLGMHRSGTSSLTRALNMLGLPLGEPLLPSAKGSNETGFWELAELVAINEEILDTLELSWDSYEALPGEWVDRLPREFTDRAIALVGRNFDGVPAFALKDPRVCRLWPFWIRVLGTTGVSVIAIHVVRAPAEVAASLARRDDHSNERSAALWIRYVLEAESITAPRLLVGYDALLTAPQDTVQALRNWLARYGIHTSDSRNEDIRAFLRPSLRHHFQLPPVPGDLGRVAQAIYAELAAMSSHADKAEARLAGAHAMNAREPLESLFSAGIVSRNRERALTARHVRNLNAIVNEHQARIATLNDHIADDERVVAGLLTEQGNDRARIQDLDNRIAEDKQAVAALTTERDALQATISALSDRIAGGERTISGLLTEKSGDQARIRELDERLANDERTLSGLLAEQRDDRAKIQELNGRIASDERTISGLSAEQREIGAQLATANDAIEIAARTTSRLLAEQAGLQTRIEALGRELGGARRIIPELLEKQRNLGAQLDTLRATLADDEATIAGLRLGAQEARTRIADLLKRADESSRVKSLDDQHMGNLEATIAAGRAELESLRESHSWRLTLPLRVGAAVVRTALNWLGLRAPQVQLVPGSELTTLSRNAYQATGNDPWFRLEIPRSEQLGRLRKGWYAFRLREVESSEPLSPKLYVDYGEGLSERNAIALPIESASGARTVIFLDKSANALRLDPSERPLNFRLEGVELRHVPGVVAVAALAWPLVSQSIRHPSVLRKKLSTLVRVLRSGGVDAVLQRIQQLSRSRRNYDYWVECYDTVDQKQLDRFARANELLASRPLISVLVPIYNTPEAWLRRCIESVLKQTYPDWELCLADDASTASHVARVVAEFAGRDARIKTVRREDNGHISAASNSALALATGDFVALLDHDDELAPFALYWIAATIAERPDSVLIYTDEDKIDERGNRFDPYFKPDWNPELLCAQNYVNHLSVYRRGAVVSAGGFREGLEGSQDWDLVLRISSSCRPDQIHHVPRILYHWRSVRGSTAFHADEKSYASDAGRRAVSESLAHAGVRARVERMQEGFNRVVYELPDPPPLVSIVIPTRNQRRLVEMCVESLSKRTRYDPYEIILIDNQSDDAEALAYFQALSRRPNVRVVRYDAPFNFSAINNFGAAEARGSVLVLLNNDIEITSSDWLAELVRHAVRPQNGVIGAKLLYPDRTIQHAGIVVGFGGVAGHVGIRKPGNYSGQMSRCRIAQNLTAVTGACLAVRKSVYLEVGGMDVGSLSVAFNDVDFCLKVAARGYRNVWTPYAELIHHESASRGLEDTPEKQARFSREVQFMILKWGSLLQRDPAYNPNLDLDRQPFELSFPPRHSLGPQ